MIFIYFHWIDNSLQILSVKRGNCNSLLWGWQFFLLELAKIIWLLRGLLCHQILWKLVHNLFQMEIRATASLIRCRLCKIEIETLQNPPPSRWPGDDFLTTGDRICLLEADAADIAEVGEVTWRIHLLLTSFQDSWYLCHTSQGCAIKRSIFSDVALNRVTHRDIIRDALLYQFCSSAAFDLSFWTFGRKYTLNYTLNIPFTK